MFSHYFCNIKNRVRQNANGDCLMSSASANVDVGYAGNARINYREGLLKIELC